MLYLAELYLPRGASLAAVARRARAGARGTPARFRQAIFTPADESCFLLYQAGSAAAVIVAGTNAGLAFDRVAVAVTAGSPPSLCVDSRVHGGSPFS